MKKIEAVFLESKLGAVRDAIFNQGVHRLVVSTTSVHEFERLPPSRWRDQSTDDESATIKVEVVVPDEISSSLANAIVEAARTRHPRATVTISPVDELLESSLSRKQPGAKAQRGGATTASGPPAATARPASSGNAPSSSGDPPASGTGPPGKSGSPS